MPINLLFGCCQIETSAHDLDAARDYFRRALGAEPIEQTLAEQIDSIAPGTRYRCDHLGVGEAVFQINQPDPKMIYNGHPSIHQRYLDSVGPCVTNLNFFIDDHAHARELLSASGAPLHLDGPSSAAHALADYGPENTRRGADDRPFMFFGTRSLIGLDLEIMEPNFRHFAKQVVQYPAFVHPRPASSRDDLLLERLRIVVPELEATLNNLVRLFTPASRSKPYGYRAGPGGRAFRIGLGGIEIEYCQPTGAGHELARSLEQFGPGVIEIDFSARNFAAAVRRCKQTADLAEVPDIVGGGTGLPGRVRLASRDPIGFDVVVLPSPLSPWAAA